MAEIFSQLKSADWVTLQKVGAKMCAVHSIEGPAGKKARGNCLLMQIVSSPSSLRTCLRSEKFLVLAACEAASRFPRILGMAGA